MSANGKSLCSCDNSCRRLGDCCVDAHTHCFGARPDETHMFMPEKGDSIISSMECQQQPFVGSAKEDGSHGNDLKNYYMISSCGDAQCMDVDTDNLHMTPVCLPQFHLIFRNIYCLLCHKYSPENAVAFTLNLFQCSHWPNELNTTSFSENTTVVNIMWKTCAHIFGIPKECEATAYRMRCPIRWPAVQQRCPAYSNPVVFEGNVYKNQFCITNTDINISCFTHDDHSYNRLPIGLNLNFSFIILLDFPSGYPISRIEIAENKTNNHYFISRRDFLKSSVILIHVTVLSLMRTNILMA